MVSTPTYHACQQEGQHCTEDAFSPAQNHSTQSSISESNSKPNKSKLSGHMPLKQDKSFHCCHQAVSANQSRFRHVHSMRRSHMRTDHSPARLRRRADPVVDVTRDFLKRRRQWRRHVVTETRTNRTFFVGFWKGTGLPLSQLGEKNAV